VALRRLRSTLSAFRAQLTGCVSRKRRRQLQKLAAVTGIARDTEVQLAWIEKQGRRLDPRHRPVLKWLIAKLEEQQQLAYRHVRSGLRSRFERLAPKLAFGLSVQPALIAPATGIALSAAAAELIRTRAASLHEGLQEIGGARDVEHAHRARIEAKRLRYLLEPLRGNARADASRAVKSIKVLQDLLGELHDSHVLADTMAEAIVEQVSENARRAHAAIYEDGSGERAVRAVLRRSRRPGLLALDRLVKERQDRLFRELERKWLDGRDEWLVREVDGVAAALGEERNDNPPAILNR
jgi:CHAD domain-containing protein